MRHADGLGPAVEWRQQRRAAPDYFGTVVAEELLGRRVPTGDDQPGGFAIDRIARGFDNRGQQRALFFGEFALADSRTAATIRRPGPSLSVKAEVLSETGI